MHTHTRMHACMHADRQRARQTERQTDRQADRQTGRQTDRDTCRPGSRCLPTPAYTRTRSRRPQVHTTRRSYMEPGCTAELYAQTHYRVTVGRERHRIINYNFGIVVRNQVIIILYSETNISD